MAAEGRGAQDRLFLCSQTLFLVSDSSFKSWQRVSMSDTASVTDVPDSCHSDPYVLSQTRPRSLRSLDTCLLTIRNDLFRDILKIVIDRPMRSRCLLKIRHDLFREKCRFEASRHNAGDRLTGAGYCTVEYSACPRVAAHDSSTQYLVPTQPVLTSTLRVAAYRWCTPLQPVLLIKIII